MSSTTSVTANGNGHPIFEANQVLKYTDLNRLFDYLDRHNRLTRTHLIGVGIACGLEAGFEEADPSIRVSPGCDFQWNTNGGDRSTQNPRNEDFRITYSSVKSL